MNDRTWISGSDGIWMSLLLLRIPNKERHRVTTNPVLPLISTSKIPPFDTQIRHLWSYLTSTKNSQCESWRLSSVLKHFQSKTNPIQTAFQAIGRTKYSGYAAGVWGFSDHASQITAIMWRRSPCVVSTTMSSQSPSRLMLPLLQRKCAYVFKGISQPSNRKTWREINA